MAPLSGQNSPSLLNASIPAVPSLLTSLCSTDPFSLMAEGPAVPQKSNEFNVVFIGGGSVMFGSQTRMWNHSLRLERKLGSRLKVVAIVDPNVEQISIVLQQKLLTASAPAYKNTCVFKTLGDFIVDWSSSRKLLHAFTITNPAFFRGAMQPGRDTEMQIMKHFPMASIFVEVPLSGGPITEVDEVFKVAKRIANAGTICSVGCKIRYLKAVRTMKQIIDDNKLTVMCTVARSACPYDAFSKEMWDKTKTAAIVEHGAHFCDLSRYLVGEVDLSTVTARSLEWAEEPGYLSKVPIDENQIAFPYRIPRVTAVTWKYESGAIGTFTHIVALVGRLCSSEFEVYADGYQLSLKNPYTQPTLHIRKPETDIVQTISFEKDDSSFNELSTWVDNIDGNPHAEPILCSYEDACKTYQLTLAICEASERTIAQGRCH